MSASILTVLSDDHNVHCLTEPMLDEWWASLPSAQKATVFEADMEGMHVLAEPRRHPDYAALTEYSRQFLKDLETKHG